MPGEKSNRTRSDDSSNEDAPTVQESMQASVCADEHVAPLELKPEEARWLARFHAGERDVMAECYEDHFLTVDGSVGQILSGADKETVVHEVFYRLLTSEQMRRSFRGGSFRVWIKTVGRNFAIDCWRRRQFELPSGMREDLQGELPDSSSFESRSDARLMVDRFRAECLPDKWRSVFEARFIQQLDQCEAARALGMHRTTLVYQEHRVRALLRRFFLRRKSS